MAFAFKVLGQQGFIPSIGFGTATLNGAKCTAAVREAIRAGYRHIDTALLYDNQAAVGAGIAAAIAAGEVTRAELFVTTKVAFYPSACDGKNSFAPIAFNVNNKKDTAPAGIAECLALLGLDYVDLLLIHNPLTDLAEYAASAAPHNFELGGWNRDSEERALVLSHRLSRVTHTGAAGEAARAEAWAALEDALAAGHARAIGVSNYSAPLVEAMAAYAKVMPAVNQLELHPRCSWPALRALAARTGLVLTACDAGRRASLRERPVSRLHPTHTARSRGRGPSARRYGSGNSTRIEQSPVVAAVAARRNETPIATVLAWTLAKGVVVIPRTADPAHIAANFAASHAAPFAPEDEAALDALNEAWPYYWSAAPSLPKGTPPDL
jgi:alcohol dehydrogenase (NADP+)